MLISLWKSLVRAPLTSHCSTLLSTLHHLCATLFFHAHTRGAKCPTSAGNYFSGSFQPMNRGQFSCFVFPKLLILNARPEIFPQYHFGGFSRCTLMVCLGSVISSQRP